MGFNSAMLAWIGCRGVNAGVDNSPEDSQQLARLRSAHRNSAILRHQAHGVYGGRRFGLCLCLAPVMTRPLARPSGRREWLLNLGLPAPSTIVAGDGTAALLGSHAWRRLLTTLQNVGALTIMTPTL